MKKLMSFLFALLMCLPQFPTAFANTTPSSTTSTTSYTKYISFSNDSLYEISSAAPSFSRTSSEKVIALPVSVTESNDETRITVDLSDASTLNSTSKRIRLSEYVMELSGYSPEVIANTPAIDKLDLIDGSEVATIKATAQASDSDQNSYGSWTSTLSYTRQTADRYMFTLVASDFGASFDWTNSICVQGFAVENNSASLYYYYVPIDENGNIIDYVYDTYYYSNVSDRQYFIPITDASGTGMICHFSIEPYPIVNAPDTYFRLKFYASNSNVNPPGSSPGSTGGSFNIYGNTCLFGGITFSDLSVSFPWGIGTNISQYHIECHTSLTATVYR